MIFFVLLTRAPTNFTWLFITLSDWIPAGKTQIGDDLFGSAYKGANQLHQVNMNGDSLPYQIESLQGKQILVMIFLVLLIRAQTNFTEVRISGVSFHPYMPNICRKETCRKCERNREIQEKSGKIRCIYVLKLCWFPILQPTFVTESCTRLLQRWKTNLNNKKKQ